MTDQLTLGIVRFQGQEYQAILHLPFQATPKMQQIAGVYQKAIQEMVARHESILTGELKYLSSAGLIVDSQLIEHTDAGKEQWNNFLFKLGNPHLYQHLPAVGSVAVQTYAALTPPEKDQVHIKLFKKKFKELHGEPKVGDTPVEEQCLQQLVKKYRQHPELEGQLFALMRSIQEGEVAMEEIVQQIAPLSLLLSSPS